MTSVQFDLGLGSGLALAGLLYLALWWWARRASSPAVLTVPSPDPTWPVPDAQGDETARPHALAPEVGPFPSPASSPSGPSNGSASLDSRDPTPEDDYRPATGSSRPPGPTAPSRAVRLSQRVILHVYAQGVLPPGAVAPPSLSQQGIGEALGVTQGGLAAVLRRLEAAGVLTAERGHVQNRDRRLKVYRLSSRGLELARDLRGRSAHGPPTARAVEPPPPRTSRRG